MGNSKERTVGKQRSQNRSTLEAMIEGRKEKDKVEVGTVSVRNEAERDESAREHAGVRGGGST